MLTWENQQHFLTMYIWVALKESLKSAKDIVANCRDMFESKISAGAKATRASRKPDAETISSWPYDMEGHAKKCVEKYCELANNTTQQLYIVATPCMDDHPFQEEENESVRELSTVCSKIVLKCLYLARVGRPDILWSVKKLARAFPKWTNLVTRNVWNHIVSWQAGRLNNSTKYLLHASMTTTSKKKKQNLLENCQIHALK